jgi:tRNA1Val (adenine37-N6)-methyltransferase
MANSFFQFKQFRIEQGHCGMKVTTDACLFGAIASKQICESTQPQNILDIGTGTGILSLMLAQSCLTAEIHALEIDQDAFEQANLNFQRSPWSDRITIEHSNFQDFKSGSKFDLIISNPPFFSKNQLGVDPQKNLALHNESLSVEQLAAGINKNLNDNGLLFLLYPPYEMGLFIEVAKTLNLFTKEIIEIKDRPNKAAIRQVVVLSRVEAITKTAELVIKQDDGSYSPDFAALLKAYYLHL